MKIKGLEALYDAIEEKINLEAAKTVVMKNTADLQKDMQKQTFDSFKKGYTVGDTRKSITLSIEDDGLTGKVTPTTEYAMYVEYGTRFMEAEPFVKPSFDRISKKFKQDMDKLVR